MSFYSERWVEKTRKPHRCTLCNEGIDKGSAACAAIGEWEGDLWHGYFHPECCAAKDAVLEKHGEWTAEGDYARGRTDDEVDLPPEFPATYRGKPRENHAYHG